jgi:hypothetical protein
MLHHLALRYAPAIAAIAFCLVILSLQAAMASAGPTTGPTWELLALAAFSTLSMLVSSFAAGWAKALDRRITAVEAAAAKAKALAIAIQSKALADQQPVAVTLALVNASLEALRESTMEIRAEVAHVQDRLDEMHAPENRRRRAGDRADRTRDGG